MTGRLTHNMGIRVCIDIGGTFTDLAVMSAEDNALNIFKNSTTPEDYALGVIDGLRMAAEAYGMSIEEFMKACSSRNGGAVIYGTTIATNAILQNRVAKVGLICTEGHRDLLSTREGGHDEPFFWDLDFPEPYVPRYLTLPASERIDAAGEIVVPLKEESVLDAVRTFKDYHVDVIAVSLLWSIANPIHETRIGELIESEWPGIPYVLSHKVNPIVREYRRTISTVINASILPIVGRYIQDFDESLKDLGYEGNLSLISSFGGIMSIKNMGEKPIYSLDSGPTGGPVAGLLFSRQEFQSDNVVTCDMGGTSFDVSRVTDGVISATADAKIGDDFLGIRKVDTRSIGAGGGSIAWVDSGGMIHVGPQSAGAQPGPACYKRGGTEPTVTDANLVLGYLNPNYLLGGRMELEKSPAYEAISKKVAEPLGIDVLEAAFTIWNTVCVNMAEAIRTITTWEGIDPQEYIFVSGGGAAGMHIIPMMADLGVNRLIIPKTAGVLSASGGLGADMVAEFQRNFECNSARFDYDGVNNTLADLKEEGLEFLNSNGIKKENQALEFSVDARYLSQPWDITIPVNRGTFPDKKDVAQLVETFHVIHDRMRGSREEGEFVEFSNWRLKAMGRTRDLPFQADDIHGESPGEEAIVGTRQAYFKEFGGMTESTVYKGDELKPGHRITPPAIIEEMSTTIVVFPGSTVTVSSMGNCLVELERVDQRAGHKFQKAQRKES